MTTTQNQGTSRVACPLVIYRICHLFFGICCRLPWLFSHMIRFVMNTRTTNKCQYLRFWRLFAFIANFLAKIAFQLPLHKVAPYFARGNLYAPLFFVYSGA